MDKPVKMSLHCGCELEIRYPPAIGENFYCFRCEGWTVVRTGLRRRRRHEIRVKCENCRYSRYYGAAQLSAEVRAAAHRRRYPTHTVVVYDLAGDAVITYAPDGLITVDGDDGTIPF